MSFPGQAQAAPSRILIVDDDEPLCRHIGGFLSHHGYAVRSAYDGGTMASILEQEKIDLVILDVHLPGEDGLALCRRLSGPGSPGVILLSASAEDTDRIIGIELGADDYVGKPCHPRELLARVRAVLRRRRSPIPIAGIGAVCEFGGWTLDLVRRRLMSPQQTLVVLSSGEFSLLTAFLQHPQTVLSRDDLLDIAHGVEFESYDRVIDVQISRLRRKLDPTGRSELIRTVRGEGYMLTAKVYRRD